MSVLAGRRVLVTGGTGFVGARLVGILGAGGARVRVLTRREGAEAGQGSTGMVVGDLTRPETLAPACQGIDAAFHLAGYAHAEDEGTADAGAQHLRVTVIGTQALVEEAICAGVKRFVFVSSVKAMGEGTEGCADELCEPHPVSAYGRAKREAEEIVLAAGRRHGFHACVLRLPLVYGPGVKGNLLRMIEAIDRRRFPPLPETGNKRSLVHVDDVVQAALLAAENPRANGQTYIVTDGQTYSTRQIYELICGALGKRVRGAIPEMVLRAGARVGDMIGRVRGRRFVFDSEALEKLLGSAWYSGDKIRRELGYEPTRTFPDAVGEMIAAYRAAVIRER